MKDRGSFSAPQGFFVAVPLSGIVSFVAEFGRSLDEAYDEAYDEVWEVEIRFFHNLCFNRVAG